MQAQQEFGHDNRAPRAPGRHNHTPEPPMFQNSLITEFANTLIRPREGRMAMPDVYGLFHEESVEALVPRLDTPDLRRIAISSMGVERQLRGHVQSLKDEKRELRVRNERLMTEIDALSARINQLDRDLGAAALMEATAWDHVEERDTRIYQLQRQLHEAHVRNTADQGNIELLHETLQDSCDETVYAEARIIDMKIELGAANEKIRKLQDASEAAQSAIENDYVLVSRDQHEFMQAQIRDQQDKKARLHNINRRASDPNRHRSSSLTQESLQELRQSPINANRFSGACSPLAQPTPWGNDMGQKVAPPGLTDSSPGHQSTSSSRPGTFPRSSWPPPSPEYAPSSPHPSLSPPSSPVYDQSPAGDDGSALLPPVLERAETYSLSIQRNESADESHEDEEEENQDPNVAAGTASSPEQNTSYRRATDEHPSPSGRRRSFDQFSEDYDDASQQSTSRQYQPADGGWVPTRD